MHLAEALIQSDILFNIIITQFINLCKLIN